MTSVGETLRRERLKRKLDLEGISNELKISARMLAAIEDERFDKLPGGVFAKSFVRQYARLLGLDEEEIAGQLQRILDPQAPSPQAGLELVKDTVVPLPRGVEAWDAVGDKRVRGPSPVRSLMMLVGVIVVCSLIYALWQRGGRLTWLSSARGSAPAPIQTVQAPPPPAAENEPQTQSAADAPPTAPIEPTAATDIKQETTEAPPPAPAAPIPEGAVRLEITAQDEVWVSARADGKFLFAVTLKPNESRIAEAGQTVLLRLGNAGGVNISLNGKPVGPVGPKGQVRSVQFTSGGFQTVEPEAPKDLLDRF